MMYKSIQKICLFCLAIAGTVPAAGFPCAAADSLTSLLKVKEQAVVYLLGETGHGPYRKKVVQEGDEWVETLLAKKFEPFVWDESAELVMNVKLNKYASDLRQMAVVYRSEGSRYKQNPLLKQRIIAGIEEVLRFFNPTTSRPGNWYQWLISLPNNLGATALMMEAALPVDLLNRLQTALRHQLGDKMVLTGTNAAWESRNHIYLALLDNDPNRLRQAADYVFRTVRFGTNQGIREDYSYLYHGHIPYAGAYGAGFLQTIAEFVYVFNGTPFAISPIHLDIIVNLAMEHTRWFLATGQIDLHVRGRTFKSRGTWNSVLEALLVLSQTDSPRNKEIVQTASAMLSSQPDVRLELTSASFADKIKAKEGELPKGFRYWPASEVGVFKRASFHVGFRQYSNRVQDYEYLNREDGGEGEEGWNLAYGFTNILREDETGTWYSKDRERREMFPEIDMEHLPGTTSRIGGNPVNPRFRRDPNVPTMSTTGFSLNFGKSPFAGGAGWDDGGAAGFILEPAYGDFAAKKSLHFFPEGFWALGSGIVSTATSPDLTDKPIHTTLLQWAGNRNDQELQLPDRTLKLTKDSTIALNKVKWFWIKGENVAVVFSQPSDIFVSLKSHIITAWLDHGTQPSDARYAYAVLPDASIKEVREFAQELPVRPLRNDEKVHAVSDASDQTGSIIFFEPDSCLGIKSQSPAIIYHKHTSEGGVFTIQDPLHRTEKLRLTTNRLAGPVNLPDTAVSVRSSPDGRTEIEVSSVLGRLYRFGYGAHGKVASSEPRQDLDMSSYRDFRVEASSDARETILTVYLPDDAVRDKYLLSVHFSKSQRLYNFSDADVVDRPSPNVVRYRWKRGSGSGPSVFSDYFSLTNGRFNVYLVTRFMEYTAAFQVPRF